MLGAYPLCLAFLRVSITAFWTSGGGWRLPYTVGSPEMIINCRDSGIWKAILIIAVCLPRLR